MARLKLSASGLRSPLEVPVTPDPAPAVASAPAPRPAAEPAPAPAAEPAHAAAAEPAPAAPAPAAAAAPAPGSTTPAPAPRPTAEFVASAPSPRPTRAPTVDEAIDADAGLTAAVASDATAPTAPEAPAPASSSPATDDADLPAWAVGLDVIALAPTRLLGRPKQTALILDRDLSTRADALVAATGPRVTFAAVVTAILHFHLPADGEAAARTIGAYRRRKLDTLDHPWEERNARLPEPLRAELDEVVAGATGRVASVHRSTLVNALLDAHLPATPDEASLLVTRMEMVRGGAFLDQVG